MEIKDKVIVVTGGANGIGRSLCRRFAAEGARAVAVVDVDIEGATTVAEEVGGLAIEADVANEADVVRAVEQTTKAFGAIDLFCSNAGMFGALGGAEIPDQVWRQLWEVNVMAHIYAARAVLPGMLARGSGYLLQTASAAGLLTQIGAAPMRSPSTRRSLLPSTWRSRMARRVSAFRVCARRESGPECCSAMMAGAKASCVKDRWIPMTSPPQWLKAWPPNDF